MALSVKVVGCLRAYENRPSTNPRGCVSDLWRFRLLAERDDCGVGSAITPRRMLRARLCARRSVESELAAFDVHAFGQGPGERRADGGSSLQYAELQGALLDGARLEGVEQFGSALALKSDFSKIGPILAVATVN